MNIMHFLGIVFRFEFIYESVDCRAILNRISFRRLEIWDWAKGSSVKFLIVFVAMGLPITVEIVNFPYLDSILRGTWHIPYVPIDHYSRNMFFIESHTWDLNAPNDLLIIVV